MEPRTRPQQERDRGAMPTRVEALPVSDPPATLVPASGTAAHQREILDAFEEYRSRIAAIRLEHRRILSDLRSN